MSEARPKLSKTRQSRKDKAVSLVMKYTPAGGKVLEVSCGAGHELKRLQDAGFEVRGTNFSQYDEEVPGVPIDHGADLLGDLPYEDETFDTVTLIDVIEHVSSHERAIEELSRVCKVGGVVIIMTPNAMKISSRVHFLFSGFLKTKREFIGFDVPKDYAFSFHNHPPHLPVFMYQLHAHGLRFKEFTASVYKWKSFLLYLPLAPFIWIATYITVHMSEDNLKGTQAARDIHRCLTSMAGLYGEFFFIVSEKCKESEQQVSSLPHWAKLPGQAATSSTEGREGAA